VLERGSRRSVRSGAIPTSADVPGPANDASAICSAASVQSVSPQPVRFGRPRGLPPVFPPGCPSGHGMSGFGRKLK
jgi:hypothetical protein